MGLPWDYLQNSTGIPHLLLSDRVGAISSTQACASCNKLSSLQEEIGYNFDHASSNLPASHCNFSAFHASDQPCFPTLIPLSS